MLRFPALPCLVVMQASIQTPAAIPATEGQTRALPEDAEVQYQLGLCYHRGTCTGVPLDYPEAIRWWRKAAEQGHAEAQYTLGTRYYLGIEIPREDGEALKWWRRAAEQGHVEAQYSLGVLCHTAKGPVRDYIEAVKWYRKAMEQGHAKARIDLGTCCYHLGLTLQLGLEGTKDEAQAVRWYREAAELGHIEAQYRLGTSHLLGLGVAQDSREAVRWYQKAAEQGHAQAPLDLAIIHGSGWGVPRDPAEAYVWFSLAAMLIEAPTPQAPENVERVRLQKLEKISACRDEAAKDLSSQELERAKARASRLQEEIRTRKAAP